jgi:hypothetical protein
MSSRAPAPRRFCDVHRPFTATSTKFPHCAASHRYLDVVLAGLATTFVTDLVLVVAELALIRILEQQYARPAR